MTGKVGGMSKDPTFDPGCRKCDYDEHLCRGCGVTLRHDDKLPDGTEHGDCA